MQVIFIMFVLERGKRDKQKCKLTLSKNIILSMILTSQNADGMLKIINSICDFGLGFS